MHGPCATLLALHCYVFYQPLCQLFVSSRSNLATPSRARHVFSNIGTRSRPCAPAPDVLKQLLWRLIACYAL